MWQPDSFHPRDFTAGPTTSVAAQLPPPHVITPIAARGDWARYQYSILFALACCTAMRRLVGSQQGVNYRPKCTQPQSVAKRLLSPRFLPWRTRVPPPPLWHRLTNHDGDSRRASPCVDGVGARTTNRPCDTAVRGATVAIELHWKASCRRAANTRVLNW